MDVDTMGLGYNEMVTQWDRGTMGRRGTGIKMQWDWGTIGQGHNRMGAQ